MISFGNAPVADLALEGDWEVDDQGRFVGSVSIEVPGACLLRLSVDVQGLGAGGVFTIAEPDGRVVWSCNASEEGACWTPLIDSDRALLRFIGAAEDMAVPEIRVLAVNASPCEVLDESRIAANESRGGSGTVSSSCHSDATCSDGDPRDAVVWICYQGESDGADYVCTGALVSDTDPNTRVPWILTANHCISTEREAQSAQLRWFFHRDCRGELPRFATLPRSRSLTLVEAYPSVDITLLRLNESPPDNALFAAWRSDQVSSSETGFLSLMHPAGSYLRGWSWAFNRRDPGCGSNRWPRYILFNRSSTSRGVTEPGASGSPLFDSQQRLVGVLSGTCFPAGAGDFASRCDAQASISPFFGAFSYAFNSLGMSRHLDRATPDDGFEPNDSLREAAQLSSASFDGILVDEDDYFRIFVPTTGRLQITLSGRGDSTRFDPDLYLLSTAGAELARSDSSTANESIVYPASRGTYVVRVRRFSTGAGDTGRYRLNWTLASSSSTNPSTSTVEGQELVARVLLALGTRCETSTRDCPDLDGTGAIDNSDLFVALDRIGVTRDAFSQRSAWTAALNDLGEDLSRFMPEGRELTRDETRALSRASRMRRAR